MDRCRTVLLFALTFFTLALSSPAGAEVDLSVLRTLSLESRPLDVAFSSDGNRIVVLLDGGEVRIFSAAGEPVETFSVEGSPDRIALSPGGDTLVLVDSSGKGFSLVRLEFIQTFATGDSPVKGPGNAPVEIVVFNDFQ